MDQLQGTGSLSYEYICSATAHALGLSGVVSSICLMEKLWSHVSGTCLTDNMRHFTSNATYSVAMKYMEWHSCYKFDMPSVDNLQLCNALYT